jgi:hypothetical protein
MERLRLVMVVLHGSSFQIGSRAIATTISPPPDASLTGG